MVKTGAKAPDSAIEKLINAVVFGTPSSTQQLVSAGKRVAEKLYHADMRRRAGAHYKAKQDQE